MNVRFIFVAALAGCASVESTPTDKPGDGLVYYLPKKDIVVSVIREAAGKITATISTTTAYADVGQPYVLNFKRNWVGNNELDVSVNSVGLLTSAKSTTTSGIADVLKNLAGSVGAIHGLGAAPAAAAACPAGTYTYIYKAGTDPAAADQPCGLKVTITRLIASKPTDGEVGERKDPKPLNSAASGFFYRQEEAYKVIVADPVLSSVNTSAVILSPSQSPVRFLPVERTLFSANKADFSFTDGIPSKYDQQADGELIGLLKLPADVISAYFAAVGSVFGIRKDTSTKEADALAASTKLEMAKVKYSACIKAIQDHDDALVQKLECEK